MKTLPKISVLNLVAFGLAALNVIIHLLVYNNLEYHRDELLYFSLGMHPAFGYATVPPMIGWLSAVLQWLFGTSIFAVKIFPALLSGAFTLVAIAITKELGGKTYAALLVGITILVMPFAERSFYYFMPVPFDIFFWALIMLFFLRYLNSGKDKWLILTGAMSGLGMLNKYMIALLIICMLLSLILVRDYSIFRKKAFYYGILAGLIIFLPNLIWQIVHDLPVINHMKELNETQLKHVSHSAFLIEQFMNPFPGTFILIPGLYFLLKEKKYRFMGFTTILVILILLILRGKSYYTNGIMVYLLAGGAVFFERVTRRLAMRIILPVLLILIFIPGLPFGIPVYKADGLVTYFKFLEDHYGMTIGRRFEDESIHSLPQDYADQIGWEELTRYAAVAWDKIPEQDKAFIYCENYGQAGAINIIGKKYGLPEPVSFNESFYYWIPRSFEPDIEYAVYINYEMGEDVKALFSQIEFIGMISNIHAREYGTSVWLCSKPTRSFNEFWMERLK